MGFNVGSKFLLIESVKVPQNREVPSNRFLLAVRYSICENSVQVFNSEGRAANCQVPMTDYSVAYLSMVYDRAPSTIFWYQ